MLNRNVISLPRSFQVERFMDDLVKVQCPDCTGYGWSAVEGCAVPCTRCEESGRIPHGPGACLDRSCRESRCIATRAITLAAFQSALA